MMPDTVLAFTRPALLALAAFNMVWTGPGSLARWPTAGDISGGAVLAQRRRAGI